MVRHISHQLKTNKAMKKGFSNHINRRNALKTSFLGALGLSIVPISIAQNADWTLSSQTANETPSKHFPNIDPKVYAEIVTKSHFDLERVRELVDPRPELAKAVWEWRFGDIESAIGAASHVGRRDIALYLLEKGARPTIYTFAMLGYFEVVQSMVNAVPGIQTIKGPHGIGLLDHAYAGKRMKDKMTSQEMENLNKTIDYLESLGDAGSTYVKIPPEEQKKYLGDYQYGDAPKEGFTIYTNRQDMLSLGPIGGFGGALYKIGENTFTYNGAPSVVISFDLQEEVVQALRLRGPDVNILAKKMT
jgi:hypothetical protein